MPTSESFDLMSLASADPRCRPDHIGSPASFDCWIGFSTSSAATGVEHAGHLVGRGAGSAVRVLQATTMPSPRSGQHGDRVINDSRRPPHPQEHGNSSALPRPGLCRADRRQRLQGTREDPELAHELLHKHLRLGPSRGYAYQLLAGLGWTSLPILPMIRQQTLILAGSDDPIIPLVNARIMQRLLPHADLLIYDDGHLGLLTRAPELGRAVTDFLSRA